MPSAHEKCLIMGLIIGRWAPWHLQDPRQCCDFSPPTISTPSSKPAGVSSADFLASPSSLMSEKE